MLHRLRVPGQHRVSRAELQLGLSSLPHSQHSMQGHTCSELTPKLPRICSLGVKSHFYQLTFKIMKRNTVQEEQEPTFSSSSHCREGLAGLGLALSTGHFPAMFNNRRCLCRAGELFLQRVGLIWNPEPSAASVPAQGPILTGGLCRAAPTVGRCSELWGHSCACNTSVKL